MTTSESGQKETEVLQAAARFECHEAERLFVQPCTGSKLAKRSAEGANANGEELRYLLHAWIASCH